MTLTAAEAEAAMRAGAAALQRGDAAGARALLTAAAARDASFPPLFFLLAQACRHGGDTAGEEAALDRVLAAQPRHVGALVMRGDCHLRGGDRRAAASFYQAAARAAAGGTLPPLLAREVARAERDAAAILAEFADHLDASLARIGAAASGRVADAIDIMRGRKQIHLQQPTSFYFPGLPQIEFYEREAFPWLAAIEAAIPAIRAELAAVVEEDGAFTPYVESDPNRPPAVHAMLGDPSWSAFHLFDRGKPHPVNAARCPRTLAALAGAPLPYIRGRSPMALFSLLRPGAHIAPHHGLLNTRLICHLPLVVPPDCALRVGNRTRRWDEGKALIFDDSIEHEAWNRSGETRVILLFEIWRPEITEGERAALTALFEAIADDGAMPVEGDGG